jgi:glucose-1-phosphate cytidylyltransferase
MDVVILCGGRGTRLSEETDKRPKPMVEIGGKPILWHIMKTYSFYGFKRFVLALGYKGDYIKQFFYNYRITSGDFSLKLNPLHDPEYFNPSDEKDWEITFVDTGLNTLKGGRIKQLEPYIKSDNFHLTYGDGLGNVNIRELYEYHLSHNNTGTVTAVRPPSRFGELHLDGDQVLDFEEKPQMHTGFINGGFFVFKKKFLEYLTPDEDCDFEFGPLQKLSKNNELKAFCHESFWQCMDNVRERDYLNTLWNTNKAEWKVWK